MSDIAAQPYICLPRRWCSARRAGWGSRVRCGGCAESSRLGPNVERAFLPAFLPAVGALWALSSGSSRLESRLGGQECPLHIGPEALVLPEPLRPARPEFQV